VITALVLSISLNKGFADDLNPHDINPDDITTGTTSFTVSYEEMYRVVKIPVWATTYTNLTADELSNLTPTEGYPTRAPILLALRYGESPYFVCLLFLRSEPNVLLAGASSLVYHGMRWMYWGYTDDGEPFDADPGYWDMVIADYEGIEGI
jgi:hypothetical protein